ncbi:MAG: molybdopterin biosynthesis protein MoeB [Gemmatimonadetes bacterium]|jgi:molybdopterin/thiamine biosynthesis adenylyltransferase/rhodanese-related sulfurtransferase|nr:molybdopterin biosynthesis protein MoeB [Gemmatimonadota bacterium]
MGAAFEALLERVKSEVSSISVEVAQTRLNNEADLILLDVREREIFAEGYIPGAENVPRGFLELQIEGISNDRSRAILLYGDEDQSPLATRDLINMGYENVAYIEGGVDAWQSTGLKTAKDRPLTKAETFRYARHLLVPEVGERGQGKLLDASVLLIGAGGLGSPAAYYLAAAGIGTVGIVDADVVDLSNLQRQILHGTSDVGRPKVVSAYEKLKDINPGCNVIPHQIYLTSDNVMEVIEPYDIVINGCDNFPTRYLINDACVFTGKPIVDGSIFRFDGQVTIFPCDKEGPCYRCLYPEPPPAEMAPSCAEAGVLGVLPGTVGLIQATEVVKLILDAGDPLIGRLLMFDALQMSFKNFNIRRDVNCPVCGDNPQITELIDYVAFCSGVNLSEVPDEVAAG